MCAAVNLVLGIDPGIASTGYGLVAVRGSRFRCVSYGVIKTASDIVQEQRLLTIFDSVVALISRYRPDAAGIETLYFAKNVTSALGVSEARGICLLAFAQAGLQVEQFAPNAIKKAVSGVANADKIQVQLAVQLLLGLKKLPEPDHAADALAAAIAFVNTSNSIGI